MCIGHIWHLSMTWKKFFLHTPKQIILDVSPVAVAIIEADSASNVLL